ncbi:MAG: TolC family protein [Kiritimatiellia bacterium]
MGTKRVKPVFLCCLFLALPFSPLRAQSSWFPEITPGSQVSRSPETAWNPDDDTLDAFTNRQTAAAAGPGEDRPLRLVELIALGLRRNPDSLRAWENARADAARLGEANAPYYPKVTFNAQVGQNNSVNNDETTYTPTTRQFSYGPQLAVTWLLLDFGSRGYGKDAARQTLIASNFQFNRALQDTILAVETAYYNLDSARTQLKAREDNLKVARATQESVGIQMKTGLASITQLLQAQQAVAQAVYDLESANAALTTAQANMAKSVGLPANAALKVEPPAGDPPLKELDATVNGMIEEALVRRPDVASKFAIFRSRLASASQARRNILPQITGNLNLQRNYFDQSYRGGEGASADPDGHTDNFAGSFVLSVDLFDGFLKWNKAREARAEAEAARQQLVAYEIAAIADVWNSYYNYKTAMKQLEAGRELVGASEKSFNATSIGYKSGLNSIVDLLAQQNNLSSARLTFIQARTSLFLASANLAYATGVLAPPDAGAIGPVNPSAENTGEEKGDAQ